MAQLPGDERPGIPPGTFKLTSTQDSLRAALERKCPRLAAWFLAAIGVMNDATNSDRLAQAAHSIREVIDKFPECAGQSTIDKAGSAAETVHKIRAKLDKLASSSIAAKMNWYGEIDVELREALIEIKSMVDEFAAAGRPRREQIGDVFRSLMLDGNAIPEVHQRNNVEAWLNSYGYFSRIAHHGVHNVDEKEFRANVETFEKLAGAQLVPTPTDDMEAIDRLIAEAERGDQS